MKFIFMVTLLLLVACHAIAQWNPNGATTGNIYYNGGNVGIGESSPSSPLHIKSNINRTLRLDFIGLSEGNSYTWQSFSANSVEQWRIIGKENDNASLEFYNKSGVSRLSLLQNGNIGIGVSQPGAKLEVNGNINVGSPNSVVLGYGATLSFLGASLNGDPLWISRYNNSANKSELRLNLGDDFGQQEDMFTIGTHHWNGGEWKPHFSVHASGKVGIGTTNPDAKLAVKGTIHAEEVKVDLQVPGPDYVFEPTYQLPSLTKIENYIKANKHLPEVPSAKEMETNGINLSEMNMLLLKKVEELTLHLIRIEKENELQRKEINELKRREEE
ncbi:hypothetical protein SanaruYs_06640 [Chryseotalea sanaruensis]|uniref:Uncharacterized protein n=1 Tax=Chryseotalea sanaruensis TaxID=2482724 RepID=A0A401U6E9_9BACT|nr:hypothetical protein [Chryseotalea sanaruensis]GCC50449.1 hypothetical protein SanaruYs_06640 [Chryseotalea sanaruensis]